MYLTKRNPSFAVGRKKASTTNAEGGGSADKFPKTIAPWSAFSPRILVKVVRSKIAREKSKLSDSMRKENRQNFFGEPGEGERAGERNNKSGRHERLASAFGGSIKMRGHSDRARGEGAIDA